MNNDLLSYQDLKYQAFNQKIIVSKYPLIGIRVPVLRKLAKNISISDINLDFKPQYYEEILLYGICLEKIKDKKYLLKLVDNYLKYVDCWSTCDNLCASLKIVKNDLDKYFPWIIKHTKSKKEFTIRFALVMLLKYYKDEKYLPLIFDAINDISIDKYYVNMAIAWVLCELYISYPEKVLEFSKKQSQKVQKMFIRKVKDSYQTNKELIK